MKVCDRCGSDRVFYDAWVNVNDPEYVITFDNMTCAECGVSSDEVNMWVQVGPKEDSDG